MMKSQYEIPSPAVIVDLDTVDNNISRVTHLAKSANIKLRPHIKVHKSVYLAKKQIDAGAFGITVAKLSEAEVMAENGIDNILIAHQLCGIEKLERLKILNSSNNIITTVDSLEIAKGLNEVGKSTRPVHILIEVDIGIHRCGVQPSDFLKFASSLKEFEGLIIDGVFTYNGFVYNSKSINEIQDSARAEAKLLLDCAKQLKSIGIDPNILSGGNTPDILALDKMTGITEVRPGNYIFNDVSGLDIGTAVEQNCAIRILATVVSVPLPGYATIDAGSKTLTSDGALRSTGFGHVAGIPGIDIYKLNEEHGFLRYNPDDICLSVGQRIEIIPNHACTIPNLCDFIYGVRNERIERIITIDARGKNY